MDNIFYIKIPWWLSVIIVLVVITIIWGWLASKLILLPPRYKIDITPKDLGLSYQDISFYSTDGLLIKGWFIPSTNAKGTIIVCHGYGTNKADPLGLAEFLTEYGYNTLLFDFRAHGETRGKCTLGYLETKDLKGAVNYLLSRSDIDKDKIGVLGISMGANVAIIEAAHNPIIRAVVADSGFSSFERTVTKFAKVFYGYPKYPFVPPAIWFAQLRTGFKARDADAIKYVSKISPRALFIIHGAKDVRIPASEAVELYETAKDPKQLWIAPQADHLEAHGLWPREYEKRVAEFFEKYLK